MSSSIDHLFVSLLLVGCTAVVGFVCFRSSFDRPLSFVVSFQEDFFGKFQKLVRSICQPMWSSITWTAAEGEPQVQGDVGGLYLLLNICAGEMKSE